MLTSTASKSHQYDAAKKDRCLADLRFRRNFQLKSPAKFSAKKSGEITIGLEHFMMTLMMKQLCYIFVQILLY
jgi:hypothetical protein